MLTKFLKETLSRHTFKGGVRAIRSLIFITLGIALFLLLLQIILPQIIGLNEKRQAIASFLEFNTGRKITVDRLKLSLIYGVALECNDVVIFEENQKSVFAQTEKLILVLKILPILKREFIVDKIILKNPQITFQRFKNGTFNFQSLFRNISKNLNTPFSSPTKPRNIKINLKAIENLLLLVHEGTGLWIDERIQKSKRVEHRLEHLNLVIPRLALDQKIPFRLSVQIPTPSTPSYLELRGSILELPNELTAQSILADIQIRLRSGNLDFLLPYYYQFLPYKKLSGNVTLKGHYLGNLAGAFKSTGTLLLSTVHFNFPKLYKKPIDIHKASITFAVNLNSKRLEINRLEVNAEDISFNGSGHISHLDDPDKREVQIDLFSERIPVASGQKFIPVNTFPDDIPEFEEFFSHDLIAGAATNVETHFRGKAKEWNLKGFKENLDLFSFRTDVEDILIKTSDKVAPFLVQKGSVALDRGTLQFINLSGIWSDSKVNLVSGAITDLFNDKTLLDLWIDADLQWRHFSEILTYNIFDILPATNKLNGDGLLKGRLKVRVPLTDAGKFALNGEIATQNLEVKTLNEALRFHKINNKVAFSGQKITFPQSQVFLGSSALDLALNFENYQKPDVSFDLKSKNFDFSDAIPDSLISQFAKTPHTPIKSDSAPTEPMLEPLLEDNTDFDILNWHVKGSLNLEKGRFKSFEYQDLLTEVDLANGQLSLQQLAFKAAKGQAQFKQAQLDLNETDLMNFRLAGKFQNFALDTFAEQIRWKEPRGSGQTQAWFNLSGNLMNKKRFLQDLNGNLKVRVGQGELQNARILAKVMRTMQLKIFGPTPETLKYLWARGDFDIQKGLVSSQNGYLKGKLGSISIVGSFDLPNQQINAYLGIHTLEGVDKIIGNLPLIGSVVGGPDRKLVTTYFLVKGHYDNPEVNLTPLHALTSQIARILTGLLGSDKPAK